MCQTFEVLCPESSTIDGDIHKYLIVVQCVLQLGIGFFKVIYTFDECVADECVDLSSHET